MSGKTKGKILVADTPDELEQKTADATSRPPTQIDIEDYTAGGTLTLQPGDTGEQVVEADVPLPDALIRADGGSDAGALNMLNAQRAKIHAEQRGQAAPITPVPDIFPASSTTRYESRIRIVEAWQYTGSLVHAPAYVDRSWAAWADWDEERKIEPGPALRVPLSHGKETEKLCRKGDYVVRQEVTIALGVEPDVRLEVWQKEEFEKFFLPTPEKQQTPPEEEQDAAA